VLEGACGPAIVGSGAPAPALPLEVAAGAGAAGAVGADTLGGLMSSLSASALSSSSPPP